MRQQPQNILIKESERTFKKKFMMILGIYYLHKTVLKYSRYFYYSAPTDNFCAEILFVLAKVYYLFSIFFMKSITLKLLYMKQRRRISWLWWFIDIQNFVSNSAFPYSYASQQLFKILKPLHHLKV